MTNLELLATPKCRWIATCSLSPRRSSRCPKRNCKKLTNISRKADDFLRCQLRFHPAADRPRADFAKVGRQCFARLREGSAKFHRRPGGVVRKFNPKTFANPLTATRVRNGFAAPNRQSGLGQSARERAGGGRAGFFQRCFDARRRSRRRAAQLSADLRRWSKNPSRVWPLRSATRASWSPAIRFFSTTRSSRPPPTVIFSTTRQLAAGSSGIARRHQPASHHGIPPDAHAKKRTTTRLAAARRVARRCAAAWLVGLAGAPKIMNTKNTWICWSSRRCCSPPFMFWTIFCARRQP